MLQDANIANKFKVRLVGSISKDVVVLSTLPVISESNTATYTEIMPTHSIGTFQVFELSPSRHFELTDVKLVSRNQQEARNNLQKILTLKGWTKSFFGQMDETSELKNWLGAPPEVLYFSAFSDDSHRGHMNRIPTVLKSISVTYPNDVDYISTAYESDNDPLGGTPFPMIMQIGLSLVEQHSAYELEQFNLNSYRNGILPAF
jgi:hypothetical protein